MYEECLADIIWSVGRASGAELVHKGWQPAPVIFCSRLRDHFLVHLLMGKLLINTTNWNKYLKAVHLSGTATLKQCCKGMVLILKVYHSSGRYWWKRFTSVLM